MPTPTSRLSYTKCFELYEAALQDPKGIRITFRTRGDAKHFQLRLHAARSLDRKENALSFEPDHVLFGRSIYDNILVKLREGDGEAYLYLERDEASDMEVVGISELNGEPKVGPELAEQGVVAIKRRV